MKTTMRDILTAQKGLHAFLNAKGLGAKLIWDLAKLGAEFSGALKCWQSVVQTVAKDRKTEEGSFDKAAIDKELEKLAGEDLILVSEPIEVATLPDGITPDDLMVMLPFIRQGEPVGADSA